MGRHGAGKVAIVGAGPGDPGLLTLRGQQLVGQAQVVLYDRLVDPKVLRWIRKDARKIPVESLGSHGPERQARINQILVEEARRGRLVVRLKGGDPFVFGRGWEEAEALEARGIPWEVVPGVTSAIAGPALAGIPVTHRACASVLTIATGHEAAGKTSVPWESIARVGGTVVVLMCSDRVREITRRLRRGGLPGSTPAALVSRASWPDQEVRWGSLATIAASLRGAPVRPPVILVVGQVVALGAPKPRHLLKSRRTRRLAR